MVPIKQQQYSARRPRPQEGEVTTPTEPDRLAQGPIPKVCSKSQLGGGYQVYGADYGSGSKTLPRQTSRQTSVVNTLDIFHTLDS